MSCDKVHEIVV